MKGQGFKLQNICSSLYRIEEFSAQTNWKYGDNYSQITRIIH